MSKVKIERIQKYSLYKIVKANSEKEAINIAKKDESDDWEYDVDSEDDSFYVNGKMI